MNSSLRRSLLVVHRWTGLTVGSVVTVLALTGAAMMFRPQLDPIVNRDLLSVERCTGQGSLDLMTARALAAHPDGKIDFIRVVRGQAGTDRMPASWIRFIDKETFYFDPCTARLLGQENRYGGWFGSIENIHRFRFMGGGSLVTGTSALAFALILIFGGLLLWLPPKLKGLGKAARFNSRLRGAPRRLSLHRFVGLYAAPVVLLSALTGLPQAFGWYKDLVYAVAGSSQPDEAPNSSVPPNPRRLSMDAYLGKALQLSPNPQEVQFRYPVKPSDPIEGFLIERGAPHPNARSMFYLDAYSGKTLAFRPYAQETAGHRFYFWTLTWHHGLVGGLFTQILLFLGALAIPVLAYTGISNYLRRRLKSARDTSARVGRPEATPNASIEA